MDTIENTPFTRETGIWILRVDNGKARQWRHLDCNDARHACVGPAYPSRQALMTNHYDYLRRAGWLQRDPGAELVIGCETLGGSAFWSRTDGWGSLEDATRYAQRESDKSTLRALAASGALWLSVRDAINLCGTPA